MSGLEVPVAAKAAAPLVRVVGTLSKGMRNQVVRNRSAASFKASLGLDRQPGISYRLACQHPLLQVGVPHPDDYDAFATVVGSDLPRWDEVVEVDETETITADFSESFVLVGGPEAESFTRLIFGYERISRGSRFIGGGLDIPFRWEENPRVIKTSYKRFVEGHEEPVSRPNWPIVDQRGGATRSIFPRLGDDGFMLDDLLLITKVPNFTSATALESGRSIVSIAGAHGTATKSITQVLKDKNVLADLAAQVGGHESFQILIRASNIRHDRILGSAARRVETLQAIPLTYTDTELGEARSRLMARHPRWRRSVAQTTNAWRSR